MTEASAKRNPVLTGLWALTAIGLAAGLWLAFTSSPDAEQGNFVRILYVHVPSAWLAFVAFGVTALGSIGWLVRKTPVWDRMAEASAEIGVLFTAVALFTGALWGKPVWGTYWDWGDARMASTALMFFVYLGYLALRRATPDPIQRARRSAAIGIIAVIQVPLVYFSVTLWRTLHQPMTIRPDGIQMDPSMGAALGVNVIVFTLLYVAMLVTRVRLGAAEAATEEALVNPAGAAVTRPDFGGVS
jgi:heme exporter protein C